MRTAVKANAADIQAARIAGQPLNAIYRTLRRKGQPVGKSYSSFRTAVRYLDQHGWPNGSASVEPAAVSPLRASVAADAGAVPVMRDRLVSNAGGEGKTLLAQLIQAPLQLVGEPVIMLDGDAGNQAAKVQALR